jgi:uncharacterized membrane protein YadS
VSQSAAISANPALSKPEWINLLPGVALLVVIGYLGKLTEKAIATYGKAHHQALPNIEYVLCAILFGLIVSNTVGVPRICRAGIAAYEFWLKAGIVFLGSRFLLGDVLKLGGLSLVLVAIELAVSIALMTVPGKWLGLTPKADLAAGYRLFHLRRLGHYRCQGSHRSGR